MAMVWRLTTRRAGRRTLATVTGVTMLWVVAVTLMPAVLPQSLHANSEVLPPAHRRIHQQQPDADYTGFKQNGLLKQAQLNKVEIVQDFRGNEIISEKLPNTKTENVQGIFPKKERGGLLGIDISGTENKQEFKEIFLEIIQQPEEPKLVDRIINPNKNIVFAPIKPNPLLENDAIEIYSEFDEETDVPANDLDAPSQSDENTDVENSSHQNNVVEHEVSSGSLGLVPLNAENNSGTAGEVDRAEEISNAAEEPLVPKQSGEGIENKNNNNEGPYTIPILKTPKEGGALPKRGGYLSRLPGAHHLAPVNPPNEEDDLGDSSSQPLVPFKGAKGAFRGVGGVFPIHPVEFQHAGGMMGEVFKSDSGLSDQQEQAQMMAMSAIQHGIKISQKQRDLIDKLSPDRKKRLEIRTKEMRLLQERAYILQLHDRKQIAPAEGGGEKVLSTSRLTIRFPSSLKNIQPEDWSPEYLVYLNITHSPWPTSQECDHMMTTFVRPHSLPTRAIASFPSSGNTWIRYLIEGATGIYTGSMYDDSSLIRKGMYGEAVAYDSGLTLLQKTHGYTTGNEMKNDHSSQLEHNHFQEVGCRGLVIVRNPFKALISHRHLDIGGHTGYAPKSQFLGAGWAEFVQLKIKLWESFYTDWLEQCPNEDVFITHYEILKSSLTQELTKILKFLHLPVDTGRLSCVEQHPDGLFHRKPSKNVPYNIGYYPRELKDKIYASIDRLNLVLKSKGKDELPISMYEMYDTTEAKEYSFTPAIVS